MWQIMRKPRWIFLLVLAVGLGSLFIRLGFWQWHKYHARAAQNAATIAGQEAGPVPLETLLSDGPAGGGGAFRRVTITGRYDIARDLVIYGRTRNGQPGNEVLTPLVLADGRIIIINRGWIPFQGGKPNLSISRPPSGIVQLTGVLEPSETTGTAMPPDGLTQVAFIDLGELSSWIGQPVLPYWVHLQTQTPPQASYPYTVPLPALDGGPYFGYALQWWFFATVAFFGYPFLLGRELREGRERAREEAVEGMSIEEERFQVRPKEGT